MNNLIAYMPVLNRQYLEWLGIHQPFVLHLISQETAESFLPRLGRNMVAVSAFNMARIISSLNDLRGEVFILDDGSIVKGGSKIVMPDEDLSHLYAEANLIPFGCQVTFESIWARWDMTAVKRQESVIPDIEVSLSETDFLCMMEAKELGQKTPDWWRQIGAVAFRGYDRIACAYCRHYPDEYETFIFSDPRINFDAGNLAGAEVYLSLHAEKGIITACAREGVSLKGASVYVSTFPCGDCARMLADCQIKELYFQEGYSVLKGYETLKAAGVRVVKVNT